MDSVDQMLADTFWKIVPTLDLGHQPLTKDHSAQFVTETLGFLWVGSVAEKLGKFEKLHAHSGNYLYSKAFSMFPKSDFAFRSSPYQNRTKTPSIGAIRPLSGHLMATEIRH